ncbi:MAG: signal peptidase II [Deltaproteobacteria bacterium]|nr:signal peptidase II [Deltaproteobacteria bacterium]
MKKKYRVLGITVAVVVLLDFVTKAFISSAMALHETFPVIGGFFNITYVRNPGAAFGFLSDASPGFRSVFFVAVTCLAIILVLYYIVKSTAEEPRVILSLSLILSGALGNLVDRVRFGEVIDFIDVYIGSHHWPAFNVADSAITIGAFLLLIEMFKHRKDQDCVPHRNRNVKV